MSTFIFWWTLLGVLVTAFFYWRSKGDKRTMFRWATVALAPLAIRIALSISGWVAVALILGVIFIFRVQVFSFLKKNMAEAKKNSDRADDLKS